MRRSADGVGILDSVKSGKRVSEAGYGVIQDPVRPAPLNGEMSQADSVVTE